MRYEVKWRKTAINHYGDILQQNPRLRPLLVDDGNRIDELLAADPLAAATAKLDNLLITQVGRLQVMYVIDDAKKQVKVMAVKLSLGP